MTLYVFRMITGYLDIFIKVQDTRSHSQGGLETALCVVRLGGLLSGLLELFERGGWWRHDGEELLKCLPVTGAQALNDRSASAGHRHGKAERQCGDRRQAHRGVHLLEYRYTPTAYTHQRTLAH